MIELGLMKAAQRCEHTAGVELVTFRGTGG